MELIRIKCSSLYLNSRFEKFILEKNYSNKYLTIIKNPQSHWTTVNYFQVHFKCKRKGLKRKAKSRPLKEDIQLTCVPTYQKIYRGYYKTWFKQGTVSITVGKVKGT